MELKDLLEGVELVHVNGSLDIEIANIAYDSRKVNKDSLFVCIEGFVTDGHKYAGSTIDNGAVALLIQKELPEVENKYRKITYIRVKDTRLALAQISVNFFNRPSEKMNLVGVTGTKGKTTTTFMIKAILEKTGQTTGIVGTIGNYIGDRKLPAERTTPEAYDLQDIFDDMVGSGVKTAVMEVSSQGLALHRVSGSAFDIGVFTNLSRDHIGGNEHKDMEEYFNAKKKLFHMCKTAVVNIDSPYGEIIARESSCNLLSYGIEKDAHIKAKEIKTYSDKVEFIVDTPWGRAEIMVNVPGIFTVYNALAAIGVCGALGVGLDIIKKGLMGITVPGRAEVVPVDTEYTIMIDYAHTPDSLENILRTVKGYAPARVISVFGCGGDRDRAKRPLMGEISGRIADFTVITSDNPRTEEPISIIKEIEDGIIKTEGKYVVIQDRTDAIKFAMEYAQKGDIIILAGKGHETYQMFKDKTIHYDEREIIRALLRAQ